MYNIDHSACVNYFRVGGMHVAKLGQYNDDNIILILKQLASVENCILKNKLFLLYYRGY